MICRVEPEILPTVELLKYWGPNYSNFYKSDYQNATLLQ